MIDRRTLGKLVAIAVSGAMLPAAARGLRVRFADPKVEWRHDPVGIDTLRPRFRWTLSAPAGARNVRQTAFRLVVVGDVGSGRMGQTLYDSGWRESGSTNFIPDAPLPLRSQAGYRWRLAVAVDGGRPAPEPAGRFVTGLIAPGDWRAQWISDGADWQPTAPALDWRRAPDRPPQRMPLLRGSFDEPREAVAAYLSIAGLGHYALSIDGVAVEDGTLRSGWTDYGKRILYDSFDVTRMIRPGRTVIGVMLGNGFFNVERVAGRYVKLAGSFGRPKLIAQLRLVFADGSDRIVATDTGWQAAAGPIVFSSIYGGEDVDARLMPAGWDRGDQAPAGFVAATAVAAPRGRMQACGTAAVAVMERYEAPRFAEPRPGVFVADLGLNFAGRPVVRFRGLTAGQRVTMKPAELLLADGTIDQTSMTGSGDGYNGIAFTHISAGAATETYRPRFTFTGFRYLQFEGIARDRIVSLVGEFMHLDTPAIGRFRCSDPQVEAIHGLIVQALRSNLQGVVTDCPQREKLGWLEQIYLNAGTIMYNRDAIAVYEKMTADMRAGQQPDGLMPSIAPEYIVFQTEDGADTMFRDTPEWGCAIVLAAWDAYRFQGDPTILRDSWPQMQAYARYLAAKAKGGLLDYGLGDWYDIGPERAGLAQLTSKKFTGTATWYAVLTTMARVARVLGDARAAQRCEADAARVRETINARLLDERTGRYDRGSQTAQAMALALGIVPDALREAALDLLIADIRFRNDHVTAGDIGFHYVVRALTDARRPDILHAMLRRTDAPSYGSQLAKGATALTEAWDADRRSSQNHFMLGHVESWFYGGLGGVRMAFGDKGPPIVIAPQMPPGMAGADVGYDSVLGPIRSAWRRDGDGARIEVEIPVGAEASVRLPGLPADVVTGVVAGMEPLARDGGTWLTLGSGRYAFDMRRATG